MGTGREKKCHSPLFNLSEQTLSSTQHRCSMERQNFCLLEEMKAQGSKRMGVPSPHLWHTKWLGFNGRRKGNSEEKKAQSHTPPRGGVGPW